jgi:fatty acid desaturase
MDHATDHATDHRAFLARVPADLRQHLTRTRDAPGLARLALHSAAIATGMLWIGLGLPYWGLAIWPTGIALSFFFTLQHECTHRTPFRTPWLNEAVGHATGLLLFQPFGWFRAFHMAHHRYTNLPGQDPELDGDKPETWAAILWHLATPGYWAAKARVLGENAFASPEAPYFSDRARPLIRREAQLYLAAYAALLGASVLWVGPLLLWVWLLPLATGFPVLRLYLLAEHGRCPQVANMLENTRTTYTNRVVRLLAWNMPYHTEHHVWPMVPFHNLPELNRLMAEELKVTSPSYRAFTTDYLANLSR